MSLRICAPASFNSKTDSFSTTSLLSVSAATMTSVIRDIVVVVVICGVVAAGNAADPDPGCVPGCTCRRIDPPSSSSLTMDCSAVAGFRLGDLNGVRNLSSTVSQLDIGNNSLTSIAARSFRGFAALQTLSVRRSRLAVVETAAFRGTRLRRLDLARNRLAAVRPRTFAGVESTLVELDLSWNAIVGLDDAFVGVSSLSRLDLRHNLLPRLTATSLRGLTGLRHLRLDHNLIAQVGQSVSRGTFTPAFCARQVAFGALTLLVGRQEGHPRPVKTEWWCAGVVVCLEQGADLHMAQLMPLPLTVSCFSKIQIGFTFLVPAHLGSLGKRAVKRVCVRACVCVCVCVCSVRIKCILRLANIGVC